jgi:hypothetical protein
LIDFDAVWIIFFSFARSNTLNNKNDVIYNEKGLSTRIHMINNLIWGFNAHKCIYFTMFVISTYDLFGVAVDGRRHHIYLMTQIWVRQLYMGQGQSLLNSYTIIYPSLLFVYTNTPVYFTDFNNIGVHLNTKGVHFHKSCFFRKYMESSAI